MLCGEYLIRDMGTCQNDWLVTGPVAHTRYIPRYIGYVTEGGFRDIPKYFCPAENTKAARQGVCNRLALQGVCNRGLVARNTTTPLFGTPPYSRVVWSTVGGIAWQHVVATCDMGFLQIQMVSIQNPQPYRIPI